MKSIKVLSCILIAGMLFTGCNMSNTGKGALIGGGSGAAVGAGLGAIFGKGKGAAIGAAVGAAVGTTAGALIGAGRAYIYTRPFARDKQLVISPVSDGTSFGVYASLTF